MSSTLLDDGDALAHSLQTMSASLETHQKSTTDILSILIKVDNRLSSLEANMAPIRRVTEQLTLAEQNVIRSYDAMKKVHDNFRVVSEADTVLRKGLAPSSLPSSSSIITEEESSSLGAYVEVVERVHESMAFLRRNHKMRSAEVTLRQLELKQQKLLSDMKDEIFRLLSSGSTCVIHSSPASSSSSLPALPSLVYHHADPVGLSLARRVKVLCESMMRTGNGGWMDAYVKARRAKVEVALKLFLEKQQKLMAMGGGGGGGGGEEGGRMNSGAAAPPGSPSRSSAGGGGGGGDRGSVAFGGGGGMEGEWLRYVCFLREVVKGEEMVFARALPGHVPQSVVALVDVLGPVMSKVCEGATEALESLLGRERSRGEKTIMLLALLKGIKSELPSFEKHLKATSDYTAARSSSSGTAAAAAAPAPHPHVRPASSSITSLSLRPISKAFHGTTPPSLPPSSSSSSTSSSSSSSSTLPPLGHIQKLYKHLCRLAISSLSSLADDVLNDSTSTKNLPINATVHVVTSNTLRAFKRIMVYEDVFDELAAVGVLPLLPWETAEDRAAITMGQEEEEDGGEEGQETQMRVYANHLFLSLLKNLRGKAEAYGKGGMEGGLDSYSAAGRPHLFLMNNSHYMTLTIRGGNGKSSLPPSSSSPGGLMRRAPSVSLASVLSEAFMERLMAVTKDSQKKFISAVWGALAEQTTNEKALGGLEYVKGTQALTFESGRLVKARFAAFNTAMEEIYTHQKGFSVPDGGLRGRLREEAKMTLLPAYTAFYEKFQGSQFSKKHMDQYLRFPPATVGKMVEELYAG